MDLLTTRIGDHRSTLNYVDRMDKPLLIALVAFDPRVNRSESDSIVAAVQEKKIPVIYLLYSDEGHGFARPENRLSYYAMVEAFLAEHLGGRYEPLGKDFNGSNIAVLAGGKDIPGLDKAQGSYQGWGL